MKKFKLLILMFLALLIVTLPATALATSESSLAPAVVSWVDVLAVAEAIAIVIVGFVVSYFKTSATFRGFVTQLIADAEVKYANAEKAGKLKMSWVIDQLYAYIPVPLRVLFSRDDLEAFAQNVFNQISKYATIQCDKAIAALQAKYNAAKKQKHN